MLTTILEALRPFPYAGGSMRQGQRFVPTSNRDAIVLVAAGLAKPVTDAPTRVMPPRKGKRKAVVQ